jgi:hypothetical protein
MVTIHKYSYFRILAEVGAFREVKRQSVDANKAGDA